MAWDGAKAESQIKKWASDDEGKPVRGKASRCYLKVVDPGDLWKHYSYPYVYIEADKPVAQEDGLSAAWGYARRFDTQLLSKIISKMRSGGFQLTDAMKEWQKTKRSLNVQEPRLYYEDEKYIEVEGIAFRQGVFNQQLQTFNEFYPFLDRILGVPIIRGDHPLDDDGQLRAVSVVDQVIGQVIGFYPMQDEAAAKVRYRFFKNDLEANEIDYLKNGGMVGTSEMFWSFIEQLQEPQVWQPTGETYTEVVHGPYLWDHIATPQNPACKPPRCGINVRHCKNNNNSIHITTESDKMEEDQVKLLIRSAVDESKKEQAAENLKLQEMLKANADQLAEAKVIVDKQAETIGTLTTTIDGLKKDQDAQKAIEEERVKKEAEAAAELAKINDETDKKMFFEWVKPGITKTPEEEVALWSQAKESPLKFLNAHPEMVAIKANAVTPTGHTVTPGITAKSEVEALIAEQGLTSVSELAKQFDKKIRPE